MDETSSKLNPNQFTAFWLVAKLNLTDHEQSESSGSRYDRYTSLVGYQILDQAM